MTYNSDSHLSTNLFSMLIQEKGFIFISCRYLAHLDTKSMEVNPNRKYCSGIRQKGHCHRALLVVLAIFCDLPSTVHLSVSSMRTAVLLQFALDLWRQVERGTEALH